MVATVTGLPDSGNMPVATEDAYGVIRLAGDLTGSADAPAIVEPPVTLTVLFENAIA